MLRIKENRRIVCTAALLMGLLFLAACAATPQQASQKDAGLEVPRISPQDAYPLVKSGQALLVCAYANEKICSTIMLEGAISLQEFESRLAGLKKDQPIIFYCS
jgi:hypothetical protein